jgi:hypothetical protein
MTSNLTDREKLERVATSYHELMTLKDKQHVTMALMIRACVQRIVRPKGAFHIDEARRIETERREAIAGLTELANMLDPPAPPLT